MPLLGGKSQRKDRGDAFEEAKTQLASWQGQLDQSWQQLNAMEEWRTFADVRRHRVEWDRDRTERFADALVAYDKALRELFQAFTRLKRELPI